MTRTDWTAVWGVVAKDLRAVVRSKSVVIPMLAVPVLLMVFLPGAIGLAARAAPGVQVERLLGDVPGDLARPILDLPVEEQLIVLVNGYLLAPLFLIVPLMVSAVLAADAFAGEKERRTLETLLHLPVRDRDIYVSKLLAGFLPAIAVSWMGFVLFTFIANLVSWPVMHRVFLPTWLWVLVILWVAPAVAALGLGIMVRVSMRVSNTQEAQQLGGAVVLPLVILAVSQTTALLLAGPLITFLAGALMWTAAIILNVRGARSFVRNRMAARL